MHDIPAYREGNRARSGRRASLERSRERWEEGMTKHTKISSSSPDLSRRSFLITAGASGLVFGFGALPGAISAAAAAGSAAPLEPSIWYLIAPDGIVTVNVGKADMGQHIASTMAQIVSEELGVNWKDVRVQLASNDPKFND